MATSFISAVLFQEKHRIYIFITQIFDALFLYKGQIIKQIKVLSRKICLPEKIAVAPVRDLLGLIRIILKAKDIIS